jgi:hypothetical protein
LSKRERYVPRHRGATPEPPIKKTVRRSVNYSGIAIAATGIAVTGGVAVKDRAPADAASATIAAAEAQRSDSAADTSLAERRAEAARAGISRSDRRTSTDKQQALEESSGGQVTRTEAAVDEDPRSIARRLMPEYGLSDAEFSCLDSLWMSESDWDPTADNPSSTAYGIPQALTGGTHENLPADYTTNVTSQIRWGLWYISNSYGSACSAWEFKQANQWY